MNRKGKCKMGIIINGKTIAEKDNEVTAARVQNLIKGGHARPKLVVIQTGNDPASSTYVRNKKIACEKVGILCEDIHIDEEKSPSITESRIIGEIQNANRDDNVNGILVQLPLPKEIDEETVLNYINMFKDVDGFGYLNAGKLFSKKNPEPFGFIPCTPAGIIHMLDSISVPHDINFAGKNAVVIGRSNIVGKPVSILLQRMNMNVTMLHSKTSDEDKQFYCRHADVIVVATGHENTLTDRHFCGDKKPIIIDVGIHRGEDGKLHGDVSEEVKAKWSSYYSPCPGGCGPLTVSMLLKNVVIAAERSYLIFNND